MQAMTKIFRNGLTAVAILCFCACAEDVSKGYEPLTELRLEAVDQPVLSRGVSSSDLQNTLFTAGQLVNTYSVITGATDGTTTWGNPLLLKAKTAEDGANPMVTTDDSKLYFPPGDNVSATINAVYPSTVASSVTTFTVQNPQTSDEAYLSSDLMFAGVTTPKTDQAVHLQFAHQMAKLVVNATGIDGVTIKAIRLLHIYQQVQFDPSTTPWQLRDNSLGAQSELVMASNGNSYTSTLNGVALFPPQTYSTTDFMDVDVKTSEGQEGTAHFLIESKAFEGGKVYTINMKIGPKNLMEGEAGQVVIAPWPASVGTINVQAVGNLGLKVESLSDDGSSSTNTLQGSGDNVYFTYNGKMCTPVPLVTDGKETDATTLNASTDYNVTYYNNLNAGTAIIVISGKGEYEGLSTFTTFPINKAANTMAYPNNNAAYTANLSRDAIVQNKLVLPSYESYRPATQKSEVYGKMTYKLYSDAGYTTEYSANDPVATIDEYGNVYMKKKGGPIYVKATMDDSGNFEAGVAQYALTITAGDVSQVISIEWSGDGGNSFVYTGSVINPTNFAIKDNGNTLAKGYDYTVTYGTGTNQTNVCTEADKKACVIITGQNEYSGTKTFYFNITQATNVWTKLNKPSVALGAPVSKTSPQGDAGDIGTLTLPAQTFNTAGTPKFGTVTFASSNTSVATVSSAGIITAVAKGSANITAKVTGTTNYTALDETIAITVEEKNRIFVYNGTTTTSASTYWQTTGGSAQECKITFAKAATVQVAVVGAGGGNDGTGRGGDGGCVVASKTFAANSSVTWYAFCGGGGWCGGGSTTATAENGKGGWPGGGRPGHTGSSGAGGGATALCTTNSTDNWDFTSNDSRMLVAGGGGGSSNGGNGGEDAGMFNQDNMTSTTTLGNPGSMYNYQGTAKKKWMGGYAGTDYAGESYKENPTEDGGAGGAGYYGGMAGSEVNSGTTVAAGGHGGSNYVKSDWTMTYNGIAGITTNRLSIKYLGFTIPYNGQKGNSNSYRVYPGFIFLRYIYDVENTEAGWPIRDSDGFETTTYR